MSNTGFLLPWSDSNQVPKCARFFFMFPANAQYKTAGEEQNKVLLEFSMSPVPSMDVNGL